MIITNENLEQSVQLVQSEQVKDPAETNEHGGFYFSSGIKIIDADSKEVLVHKRCD